MPTPCNLRSLLRLALPLLGVLASSTSLLPAQQASVGINLAGGLALGGCRAAGASPLGYRCSPGRWCGPPRTATTGRRRIARCSSGRDTPYNEGTYALSFNGQATIAVSYNYGTVNGASSGTCDYNAATNTTTATVVITDTSAENCSLIFTSTPAHRRQRHEHRLDQRPPLPSRSRKEPPPATCRVRCSPTRPSPCRRSLPSPVSWIWWVPTTASRSTGLTALCPVRGISRPWLTST